jgi:translation initiation factor 2 beta subunit (eIF-2beta)/eIF-5
VRFSRCKECDKPIIESTKKKGRASVYCCKECRWAHERPNP